MLHQFIDLALLMGAFKDWRMISGKNAQNQKTKKLALLIVKFSLSSLCHIFYNPKRCFA
jgi:hypothetical protein